MDWHLHTHSKVMWGEPVANLCHALKVQQLWLRGLSGIQSTWREQRGLGRHSQEHWSTPVVLWSGVKTCALVLVLPQEIPCLVPFPLLFTPCFLVFNTALRLCYNYLFMYLPSSLDSDFHSFFQYNNYLPSTSHVLGIQR